MLDTAADPTDRFQAFVRSGLFALMVARAALGVPSASHAQSDYFFLENVRFDPDIPSPAEFLGYDIGSHHMRHGCIVAYFRELARWLRSGGTLITIRRAGEWVIEAGLVTDSALVDADTRNGSDAPSEETDDEQPVERHDFADADDIEGAQQIGGSIYEVDLDTTHPLGFGYHRRELPVYRDHRIILPPTDNPYGTVARYTDDPHLSGYVSDENLDKIRNSASLIVDQVGRRRIILFADNPNFWGMWYGTNKRFFNALSSGR